MRQTIGRLSQSCNLVESNPEYGLDIVPAKRLWTEFAAASRQVLQADGKKIPHLFKCRPDAVELSEIDQIG